MNPHHGEVPQSDYEQLFNRFVISAREGEAGLAEQIGLALFNINPSRFITSLEALKGKEDPVTRALLDDLQSKQKHIDQLESQSTRLLADYKIMRRIAVTAMAITGLVSVQLYRNSQRGGENVSATPAAGALNVGDGTSRSPVPFQLSRIDEIERSMNMPLVKKEEVPWWDHERDFDPFRGMFGVYANRHATVWEVTRDGWKQQVRLGHGITIEFEGMRHPDEDLIRVLHERGLLKAGDSMTITTGLGKNREEIIAVDIHGRDETEDGSGTASAFRDAVNEYLKKVGRRLDSGGFERHSGGEPYFKGVVATKGQHRSVAPSIWRKDDF